MDTIIVKPAPYEITDEECQWLEQRRAAAADNAPVSVADLTPAKVNGLSKAEIQRLLDRITAGNITS
jgi:ABC-type antimicrobial peptide transport system ATPase subunit